MTLVSTLAIALERAAVRAAPTARRLMRIVANRIAVTRMAEMDDERLRDLGLSRRQLRRAVAVPLHLDPMDVLRADPRFGERIDPAEPIDPRRCDPPRPRRVRAL